MIININRWQITVIGCDSGLELTVQTIVGIALSGNSPKTGYYYYIIGVNC